MYGCRHSKLHVGLGNVLMSSAGSFIIQTVIMLIVIACTYKWKIVNIIVIRYLHIYFKSFYLLFDH